MLNPNSLYTLVLGAIALIFVLSIRNRINIFLFFALFIVLSGVGLSTMSRGFLIIYIPLVAVFAIIKLYRIIREKGNYKQVILFAAAISAFFVIMSFVPQFRKVIDRIADFLKYFDEYSGNSETLYDPGRWGLWKLYVETWAGSAWSIIFGMGFAPPIGPWGVKATTAHNMFIAVLTQTGIVGFALFTFCIFCIFRSVCKTRSFKFECCLPILAVIGFCMVETSLFRFQVYLLIVLILLCMPARANNTPSTQTI